MGQEQFNTIMPGISAELIEMISEKQNISEGAVRFQDICRFGAGRHQSVAVQHAYAVFVA